MAKKIDIIEYSLDPVVYISNALAPAHVTTVLINEDKHSATVIVPDNQLSLAIGRKGQNARLAVRLTGWKIDIKSESDAVAEGIEFANQSIQEETVIEELKEAFVIETPVIEEAPIIEEETMTMAELLADKEKEEVVETVIEPDVMPIYTEEELAEIDENEVDDHSHYDEDIDYDEYDKYYDN